MLFSAVIRNLVCLYKMVTYKKGGGKVLKKEIDKMAAAVQHSIASRFLFRSELIQR